MSYKISKFISLFLLIPIGYVMADVKEEKFDWDQIIKSPKADEWWWDGHQVLNFYPCDKYYRDSEFATVFVEKYLFTAKALNTDAAVLKFGSDNVILDGAYIEMGVCTGRTINFIAALNPEKRIFGFDSFEGLPEEWRREDIFIPKGTFALKNKDQLPSVLHNVMLFKGMFCDSLVKFKEQFLKDKPIAFIHVDCDIYSSTKDVFDILGDNLVVGSVIVFDEFYNYPGSEKHEFKAFQEFLKRTGKKASYIAYNQYFEQVVVKIIE